MSGYGIVYILNMGVDQLLPFKIHSNFSSSNKIIKKLVIPFISVSASVEIFPSSFFTHIMSIVAYSIDYGWFYLNLGPPIANMIQNLQILSPVTNKKFLCFSKVKP